MVYTHLGTFAYGKVLCKYVKLFKSRKGTYNNAYLVVNHNVDNKIIISRYFYIQ